ncbi:MAG TPA: hypothetical protein ENN55_01185 [Firmicutes bacterium]|nr:hypothetical protein [Bacillota bacterium]
MFENIKAESGRGDIIFESNQRGKIKEVELKTEKGNIFFAPGADVKFEKNAGLKINAAKGYVFFVPGSAVFGGIDKKHEGAKELKFISTAKDGPGMYIYSGKGLKTEEKK